MTRTTNAFIITCRCVWHTFHASHDLTKIYVFQSLSSFRFRYLGGVFITFGDSSFIFLTILQVPKLVQNTFSSILIQTYVLSSILKYRQFFKNLQKGSGSFAIVRFMSQCKRIFGDISFTSCPIKLKFSSIISTFQTNSEA